MKYVVIENWETLSSPQLCVTGEGETAVFDNIEDAQEEASYCQDGIVIPLSQTVINEGLLNQK